MFVAEISQHVPHGDIGSADVRWLLPKRMFARDATRLGDWLLQLADTDQLDVVIPGHSDPITLNAPATLRTTAATV